MKSFLSTALLILLMTPIVSFGSVEKIQLQPIDINEIHSQELLREQKGDAPRFAIPNTVNVRPTSKISAWKKVGDKLVWRKRIISKNAVSLNFAFTEFNLPENATLIVRATDFSSFIRPFTSKDNNRAKQLWTPVIMSDDVTIELFVPADKLNQLEFALTKINQGFRTFAQKTEKSGSCNVDVVCSEGNDWQNEINAVAVISTGGSTFCTGFMVNNAKQDKTPFFMTANHCRITEKRAPSLVTYWNYQTSGCKGGRDGKKVDFQTGATFLAANAASDFTLVKLNEQPKAEWNVNYAGWDRSGEDATTAIAIHHPSTDEKSISFEYDKTTVTGYLKEEVPGAGTHVRVTDWDVGTTEPGSSGSPLFNQDHRVIGQLHGGYASCSSQTSDWYGRFAVSWEGAGTPVTSLKGHLDPENTEVMFVDTIR